jgi:hypothetical protein
MGSFQVVVIHPRIEVLLQVVQVFVQFFAKGHTIKLFLHGAVQSFTNAIALRMPDLGFGLLNASISK